MAVPQRALLRWPCAVALGLVLGAPAHAVNEGPVRAAAPEAADPRSYSTRREPDPPRYSRPLELAGIPALADLDWLTAGFEYRVRFEHRDNDFRRSEDTVDTPLLFRGRAFAYVRNRFDPFRFGLELQDARRSGSDFPEDDRDVNEFEPVNAFGELYFEDALGRDTPLSLRAGRFTLDLVDRRLIGRNEWRNTVNTGQGLRATLGTPARGWQLDLLALRPIERRLDRLDRADEDRALFGVLADWRKLADIATLQPYWLRLEQAADPGDNKVRRDIDTWGLRAYGLVGRSGLDWDVNFAWQTGRDGRNDHRAFALNIDSGYTFDVAWRPRVSLLYTRATGDADPTDLGSGRFERLFGVGRVYSSSNLFQLENLRAPKVRIEAAPTRWLRLDGGYNRYWLDSATDRWNLTGLRDPTGAAGRYLGQEWDARARATVGRVTTSVGYAWFDPGRFTATTSGRDEASHFLYVEVYLTAFR